MNKPETTPPTYFHHLRYGTLADVVPLNARKELLVRQAANVIAETVQTQDGKTSASNILFTSLQTWAFREIVKYHPLAGGTATCEAFAEMAFTHGSSLLKWSRASERYALYTARAVALYAWSNFNPTRQGSVRYMVGACWDDCRGKNREERQAIGAAYARGQRHAAILEKLTISWMILAAAGTEPTNSTLAKHSGVSRKTVGTLRNEVRSSAIKRLNSKLPGECVVSSIDKKKLPLDTAVVDQRIGIPVAKSGHIVCGLTSVSSSADGKKDHTGSCSSPPLIWSV